MTISNTVETVEIFLQTLSTNEIVMQIWRNDSLNDFCTWTLFQQERSYILRTVIWKQNFEYKLKKPITYASDTLLDNPLANELEALAKELMCTERDKNKQQLTIDGIFYGINYFDKYADTISVKIVDAINTKKLEIIINRINRNSII